MFYVTLKSKGKKNPNFGFERKLPFFCVLAFRCEKWNVPFNSALDLCLVYVYCMYIYLRASDWLTWIGGRKKKVNWWWTKYLCYFRQLSREKKEKKTFTLTSIASPTYCKTLYNSQHACSFSNHYVRITCNYLYSDFTFTYKSIPDSLDFYPLPIEYIIHIQYGIPSWRLHLLRQLLCTRSTSYPPFPSRNPKIVQTPKKTPDSFPY